MESDAADNLQENERDLEAEIDFLETQYLLTKCEHKKQEPTFIHYILQDGDTSQDTLTSSN
jgi:hypothetical protein